MFEEKYLYKRTTIRTISHISTSCKSGTIDIMYHWRFVTKVLRNKIHTQTSLDSLESRYHLTTEQHSLHHLVKCSRSRT